MSESEMKRRRKEKGETWEWLDTVLLLNIETAKTK
jgi:hypothetical protein